MTSASLNRDWLWVWLAAVVTFLTGLGATRLWDEDEGFFAATAALCFAASMVFPAVASAAEIRVLCSMALNKPQQGTAASKKTKAELIASLQNEVRILLHLAGKVDAKSVDYRPTPKQRSTIEWLRYLTLMGPGLTLGAKTGAFDGAAWGAAQAKADAMNLEQVVAEIAKQPEFFAKEIGVSFINGLLWGAVVGLFAFLIYHSVPLRLVMTGAMVLNLLLAAIMGVTIPLLMQKRDVVGIAQTGNDLSPCNRHHLELALRVREGIRAAVIDKDRQPKWRPATIAEVTPEIVARYFEDRGDDELKFPG